MTKYYVTVESEVQVTLEEVYLVHASDPDHAESIVANGGGEWLDEEITDYGKTISERVIEVKSS